MSKKKDKKVIKMNAEELQVQPQISKKEMKQAIDRALQEASLRFQCLELAQLHAESPEDMMKVADTYYNYAFHLDKSKQDSEVMKESVDKAGNGE